MDQYIRLKALKCWITTQRNVAVWVASVYGFMNAGSEEEKQKLKTVLQKMIRFEITNTEEIMQLLSSGIEFIALTDKGETPLMHGTNLRELLARRISLMKEHMDDDPYIDMNYIERKAGEPIY
jgi:hypothetical protein